MSGRKIFARSVFPLVLFGGVAIAIRGIERGVGHGRGRTTRLSRS